MYKLIKKSEIPSNENFIHSTFAVDGNCRRKNFVHVIPMLNNEGSVKGPYTCIKEFKSAVSDKVEANLNVSIQDLVSLIGEGYLLINKSSIQDKVQRNVAWDDSAQSNFVVNCITGFLHINPIVLQLDDDVLNILAAHDGQQRCIALYKFLAGELKLSKTNTVLDGKYFKDLPPEMKEKIKRREIAVSVVAPELKFLRSCSFSIMNSTGKPLNTMENLSSMYNSDYLTDLQGLLKSNPILIQIFYSDNRIIRDKKGIPVDIKSGVDRKNELNALVACLALTEFPVGDRRLKTNARNNKALVENYLSYNQGYKLSAAKRSEIIKTANLMISLFGEERLNKILKDNEGCFLHYQDGELKRNGSRSSRYQRGLYLISYALMKSGITSKDVSPEISRKAKDMWDEMVVSPAYVAAAGNNNSVSEQRRNMRLAENLSEIFGVELTYNGFAKEAY